MPQLPDTIVATDFQNFGIALLTILVPLSIAVLAEYFRTKENDTGPYATLDLHVILDYMLSFRFLLLSVGLIFVPILIWGHSSNLIRWWILFGWAVGNIFILITLLNFYKWIKGNKQELRLDYYKGLTDADDLLPVTDSIWKAPETDPNTDRLFFIEFMKKLNDLLND